MSTSTLSPLVRDLRTLLGPDGLLWADSDLVVYECDGYTIEKCRPDAVVFPRSTKQVAEVVKICNRQGVPLVPRGAGTSLAGGCLPLGGGVVMMLTRMKEILQIDVRNRMAVVEAGVLNIQLSRALSGTGYHFAPDPSSQGASTIGGNVATNAGGPHTLKYGVTVNHVLGLEAVLGDGSMVQIGPVENRAGLDLLGPLVGSEGTLAVVTKIWVRLTPNPQDYRAMRAIFDTVDDATNAISDIIGAGMIPAAMELMDQGIIAAVEEAYHFGFPLDAGAVAVIELDGLAAGIDQQQQRVVEFCRKWRAREVLQAATAQEREMLWKCRKMAVGAVGRLSPSYCIQDGVVPRTRLPHILRRITQIAARHGVRIVNVAHAGDGNVHPILLFDERDKEEVDRVLAAGHELLEECVACGGSVTAEHGIGVEKLAFMPRLFTAADLEAMARVQRVLNPAGRLSPGKLLPPLAAVTLPQEAEQSAEPMPGTSAVGSAGECRGNPGLTPGACQTPGPAGLLPLCESVTVSDQDALSDLIGRASRRGTPVYPIGGGTRLSLGARPSRPGIGVSLANLTRLIDYPARDLTITVEAGMTVARLAKHLAAEGQWLPVDVPHPERATVGGIVAVGQAGPRRCRWGTLRDYVIGVRAVDGRGMTYSGGGRVVKNAAGYNMCRLLTGSLGTLGLITQVTLMVKPMPETSALVACDLADADAAERVLSDLTRAKTVPSAVELVVGPAEPGVEGMWPGSPDAWGRLIVGLEGTSQEVHWMLDELQGRWNAIGTASPATFWDDRANRLWQALAEFPRESPSPPAATVAAELHVLPGETVATIERVVRADPGGRVLAHAADGVVRVEFSLSPEQAVDAVCNRLRPAAASAGGSVAIVAHPPEMALSLEAVWGALGDVGRSMRALQRQFDPKGILNPGRFAFTAS